MLLFGLTTALPASAGSEWLSHVMCAIELNKVLPPQQNKSDFHIINGALITSMERPSGVGEILEKVILLVTPGQVFEYLLPSTPSVMAQLTVPNPDPRLQGQLAKFTYAHSEVQGHYLRLQASAGGRRPSSSEKKPIQLVPRVPQRIDVELQILSAINGKLAAIRSLVNTGRIKGQQLLVGNMTLCQGLGGSHPDIASHINRSVLDLSRRSLSRGNSRRVPASLPAATPKSLFND